MARRPDPFQLGPGSAQSASTAWIFMGGDGKLEHGSTTLETEGVCRRRAGGDESRTRCFRLFLYHKDMTFAEFDERDQTRAGEKAPTSPLAGSNQVYYLAGICQEGAAALYTTFTHY